MPTMVAHLFWNMCVAGILFVLSVYPVLVHADEAPGVSIDGSSYLVQLAGATNKTGKAYLYEHPRQGYFIRIPENVVLQDRGDKRGIALKSRKGYLLTLQTNAANPGIDLVDMLFRLETKYLGKGKPWSRKLKKDVLSVAGLNSIEAVYEGAGTRVRAVIVRGLRLDYAFIFLSSPANFVKLSAEFDWILEGFKPAPGDLPEIRKSTGKALNRFDEKSFNVFKDKDLGFSISYPLEWVGEREDKHSVVISGKPETPAYYVTISIQNIIKSDKKKGTGYAVSAALKELRDQIKSAARDAMFSGEGPYIYSKAGVTLNGGQFTVSYGQGNTQYKQLSIILARPNDNVIHHWSYAAPVDLFLKYSAVAKMILESWTIESAR